MKIDVKQTWNDFLRGMKPVMLVLAATALFCVVVYYAMQAFGLPVVFGAMAVFWVIYVAVAVGKANRQSAEQKRKWEEQDRQYEERKRQIYDDFEEKVKNEY